MGFGNDAPIRFGPPRYEDAEIALAAEGGRVAVTLRDIGP
jgi:uncharacterized protein (DUF2141 family)